MRHFTFKKRLMASSLSVHSSFKSFLALVVVMLMATTQAFAEAHSEVIDGLRYLLESETKTAELLSKSGKYSGDIVVPEKVKGNDGVEYSVTSLEEKCFSGCSSLTSITIPSSVTSLGDYCFAYCSSLTSITIPSSVTSLGSYCFYSCI